MRWAGFLGSGLVGLLLASPAQALPASPQECDGARSEIERLTGLGVAEDMARGPDWGRDNLSRERLDQVARWLEVQETILFRCPRTRTAARTDTPAEKSDGPGDKGPVTNGATEPATATGKSPSKAKKAAVGEPAPDSGPGEIVPKPAKDKSKPSGEKASAAAKPRKPKPPVDDAYQPPTPLVTIPDELQHATPGKVEAGTALAP